MIPNCLLLSSKKCPFFANCLGAWLYGLRLTPRVRPDTTASPTGTGRVGLRRTGCMRSRPIRIVPWIGLLLLLLSAEAVRADDPPDWLPRYDVDVVLDTRRRMVRVCEDVTWV